MDFRVPRGPFEPPLEDRIRIDQSQGYEPCGLNLGRLLLNGESTPPRYAPVPQGGVLFFFSMALEQPHLCNFVLIPISECQMLPRHRHLDYEKVRLVSAHCLIVTCNCPVEKRKIQIIPD